MFEFMELLVNKHPHIEKLSWCRSALQSTRLVSTIVPIMRTEQMPPSLFSELSFRENNYKNDTGRQNEKESYKFEADECFQNAMVLKFET